MIVYALRGSRRRRRTPVPLLENATGRAFVWASMSAAHSLPRLGRIAEAFPVLDRGHAAHLALAEPIDRYPWIHHWLRCEALALGGRLHESEALALEQHQEGIDTASLEQQAYFAWHLATVVGDRGHVVEAARHAREGIALNRELGRPHYVGECLIGLATALALAGLPRDAAQALAAFDDLGLVPATAMFKPVELTLARGWAAVAAGDLDAGRMRFEEAAEQARDRRDLVGEAAAWHCLARVGYLVPAVDRLADLAARSEGGLVAARSAHADALAADDPAQLAACRRHLRGDGRRHPGRGGGRGGRRGGADGRRRSALGRLRTRRDPPGRAVRGPGDARA